MKIFFPAVVTTKTAFFLVAASLGFGCNGFAVAGTQVLARSGSALIEKPQPLQPPRVLYRGRVKPEVPALPSYHQVISESPGYYRDTSSLGSARAGRQRPRIAARLYYQAPSTTMINRQVDVMTPQNATSDVYFNQDTYYLYPSGSGSYHPAQRYIPPVIPVSRDPQATENRAKQWTDKADFNQ